MGKGTNKYEQVWTSTEKVGTGRKRYEHVGNKYGKVGNGMEKHEHVCKNVWNHINSFEFQAIPRNSEETA